MTYNTSVSNTDSTCAPVIFLYINYKLFLSLILSLPSSSSSSTSTWGFSLLAVIIFSLFFFFFLFFFVFLLFFFFFFFFQFSRWTDFVSCFWIFVDVYFINVTCCFDLFVLILFPCDVLCIIT